MHFISLVVAQPSRERKESSQTYDQRDADRKPQMNCSAIASGDAVCVSKDREQIKLPRGKRQVMNNEQTRNSLYAAALPPPLAAVKSDLVTRAR